MVKTGRLDGRSEGSWAAKRERVDSIYFQMIEKFEITMFFVVSELACAIVVERAIHSFAELGVVILKFL